VRATRLESPVQAFSVEVQFYMSVDSVTRVVGEHLLWVWFSRRFDVCCRVRRLALEPCPGRG